MDALIFFVVTLKDSDSESAMNVAMGNFFQHTIFCEVLVTNTIILQTMITGQNFVKIFYLRYQQQFVHGPQPGVQRRMALKRLRKRVL